MRALTGSLILALLLSGCSDELAVTRASLRLEVSPNALDFGDVALNTERVLNLELENDGTILLELTGELSTNLGGEFTVSEIPSRLQPRQRELLQIRFAPSTAGIREGMLVFQTNSLETPTVEVPITGRGVEPALIADPTVVDFGRVVVGRTVTATITLTNSGDRVLEVIRATVDPETLTEFTADVQRSMLDPATAHPLVISYTPSDLGPDEGRVLVLDNGPRAEQLAVLIRGLGVESDIEVEPLNLSFTGLYAGQTQTLPFFVRNIGEQPHLLTALQFVSTGTSGAGEFSLDAMQNLTASLPITIAPGEAQQVDVVYQPIDAISDMAQISVESTGLPAPVTVIVNGEADPAPTPRIEVMPAALDFGQVEVNQSRPLNLRINNVGNADLILNSLSIEPAGAPYSFSMEPTPGTSLRPQDSSEFQVLFNPTQVGTSAAEVVIASSDPSMPEVRIPLTGEGINTQIPSIFVDPNPLDFGMVPRGVSASRSLLVRNDGTAPLVVQLVLLNNNAGGRFTVPMPPASNTTLQPGQQLNFAVEYFDNGIVMTHNGMLEIQSNAPTGPVMVPLSATTEPPPPAITDIAINLTWTSTNADIDLHLLRPGGSFFDRPDDCCFCNTNPDWGVANQNQDNPFLDRDDLFGPGPENINLTQAENGEYQVVVHYFNDRGDGPVSVNVEVQIRGVVVGNETVTIGGSERWIAGRIQWNSTLSTGTWNPGFLGPFPTLFSFCF